MDNQPRLKRICFKLYNGNDKANDLFQEFYLQMIQVSEDYRTRYPIEKLSYLILRRCYLNRDHNKALRGFDHLEIGDVGTDAPNYFQSKDLKYLEQCIEEELNRPHGFAPVMVFMQSLKEPLRAIERKTGINIYALSKYREQGRQKLLRIVK